MSFSPVFYILLLIYLKYLNVFLIQLLFLFVLFLLNDPLFYLRIFHWFDLITKSMNYHFDWCCWFFFPPPPITTLRHQIFNFVVSISHVFVLKSQKGDTTKRLEVRVHREKRDLLQFTVRQFFPVAANQIDSQVL